MIDTTRHTKIFDSSIFSQPVHIIGCGGMGSRIAEGLVRMGVGMKASPIILYDGDAFESHNLANQLARGKDIGLAKVEAVKAQLLEINPKAHIKAMPMHVKGQWAMQGVVFICVDSMRTRRELMEDLILRVEEINCVIETRMDAEAGISHCFDPQHPKHIAAWKLHWFSDNEQDSIQGCSGSVSIISAIYGTTMLALKQFEQYAGAGSAWPVQHRLYQNFKEIQYKAESWS